jgi:hypothetical protein
VAELSLRPVGSVSPSVIADWAGLVPLFVSVKTSVVAVLSAIDAAPNALATLGFARVTTRHWSVEVLVAAVVVTEADRFVKAAGLPTQLALVCVGWLVRPETVTVQLAVPAVMARPVNPESTRVPALYAAFDGPEQPAE